MIKPALQDDQFLADVNSAYRDSDVAHLWWLGQSGFLFSWMEDFVAIDPYLSDSLTAKYAGTSKPHVRTSERVVDPARLNFPLMILSTHIHTDHLDPATLRPMLRDNPQAQVLAPAADLPLVAERTGLAVDDLWGMDDGTEAVIAGFRTRGVPAAHDPLARDERGRCRSLGYVIKTGPLTVYHSGDTVVYDGMADRLRREGPIDVAILPINGKVGNMGGRDAARLAKEIGARLVIPCHYDMFAFNTADPADEFVPECERIGQPYRVLKLGERFSSSELPPRG